MTIISARDAGASENKFYTWSHPKIFIFASVISVSFAQNRPKSDISGALGPIDYIHLYAIGRSGTQGCLCNCPTESVEHILLDCFLHNMMKGRNCSTNLETPECYSVQNSIPTTGSSLSVCSCMVNTRMILIDTHITNCSSKQFRTF